VSRYQKGKTNLDFIEARDSEWQWHQLGHMQVCTSPQTDNHSKTSPLSFLQAGCPSCRPTNSVKALKELSFNNTVKIKTNFNNYNFWYMKFYENLMQATANLSTTPDNYHCPTMRKVDLMQLMGAKPFPLRLGWSENVMVLHSNLQLRQVR